MTDIARDEVLLFGIPEQPAHRRGEWHAPAKTAAALRCPECVAFRATGLVRQGDHLVWRVHSRRVGKHLVMCKASGTRLCEVPDRDGTKCTCQSDAVARLRAIAEGVRK